MIQINGIISVFSKLRDIFKRMRLWRNYIQPSSKVCSSCSK